MTRRPPHSGLLAVLILAAAVLSAATPRPTIPDLPPDLKARAARIWAAATPAGRNWATQEGHAIAKGPGDPLPLARATAIRAKAGSAQAFDFSHMTIEDAMVMIVMVIAEDARNGMRDALAEMEAARAAREKLRAAQSSMKAELDDAEKRERQASLRLKAATERAVSVNATLETLLRQAPLAAPAPTPGRK